MFSSWKTKFMDGVGALKGDIKELDKYLNLDEVKKNFDKFYPEAERKYDWLTRGQSTDINNIPVPSDIPVGKEKEYRWVVGAPPAYMDANAKQQPSMVARYAKAIARLRANPTEGEIEIFDKNFPGGHAKHILQLFGPSPTNVPGAVPYVPPAPAAPVATRPTLPAPAGAELGEVPHHELTRARRHLPIGGGLERLFKSGEMTPEEKREREREAQ
jgi:hypothetical protein